MRDNEILYSARLENMVLMEGKELDISGVEDEFRKDCVKILLKHLFFATFSLALIILMIIFRGISFATAQSAVPSAILILVFGGITAYSVYEIVALWRAKSRGAFQGIRGTCDNLVITASKN